MSAHHDSFGHSIDRAEDTPAQRKRPNAAPLGLCAFALTTFLLGLDNVGARGLSSPKLVVGSAYAYGGLVQILAGMWEMAAGSTVTATALTSYGAFWISFAIIQIPGGFQIIESLGGAESDAFYDSFGLFLIAWFIFTTLIVVMTLRTTVASCGLFVALDLAFLLLSIANLHRPGGMPHEGATKAGGVFCLLAAFGAWYNALAGLQNESNSGFRVPVGLFPWSKAAPAMHSDPALVPDKSA